MEAFFHIIWCLFWCLVSFSVLYCQSSVLSVKIVSFNNKIMCFNVEVVSFSVEIGSFRAKIVPFSVLECTLVSFQCLLM